MKIKEYCDKVMETRKPDLVIGDPDDPYLLRWWLLPRNKLFNVYLHKFLRDDIDEALHDHPWLFNCSWLIDGRYLEWVFGKKDLSLTNAPLLDGHLRKEGDIKFRWGKSPHRIALIDGPVTTIFITGPRIREWGFYCPKGWVHWKKFLGINYDYNSAGNTGRGYRGCGD